MEGKVVFLFPFWELVSAPTGRFFAELEQLLELTPKYDKALCRRVRNARKPAYTSVCTVDTHPNGKCVSSAIRDGNQVAF